MSYTVNITNAPIPGVGVVTGTVEYDPGCFGSYWDPPEEPEVCEVKLVTSEGVALDSDSIMESEAQYAAVIAAAEAVLAAEQAAEAEALAKDFDPNMPF